MNNNGPQIPDRPPRSRKRQRDREQSGTTGADGEQTSGAGIQHALLLGGVLLFAVAIITTVGLSVVTSDTIASPSDSIDDVVSGGAEAAPGLADGDDTNDGDNANTNGDDAPAGAEDGDDASPDDDADSEASATDRD
jgi:hypothetical protein